MKKFSDKIIFSATIVMVTFAWAMYALKNWRLALIITFVVYLLSKTLYLFFNSRRNSLKNISSQEMCISFAIMGQDASAQHLYSLIPSVHQIAASGQYITAMHQSKKVLIMVNYKFGNTTEEDIAKAYRKAKEIDEITEIIILSRHTDRGVMSLAARLDINFKFINKRVVRKSLIAKNAMPKKVISEKAKKISIDYKELLISALDKRRIKYYLFTGTIIFIMSFFSPLKLYYLILTTVPLSLAGLSALYSLKE